MTKTDALATHVDLAADDLRPGRHWHRTRRAAADAGFKGSISVRCSNGRKRRVQGPCPVRAGLRADAEQLNRVRYALRGFFDGETKYARYYGVGGGKPSTGLWGKPTRAKSSTTSTATSTTRITSGTTTPRILSSSSTLRRIGPACRAEAQLRADCARVRA